MRPHISRLLLMALSAAAGGGAVVPRQKGGGNRSAECGAASGGVRAPVPYQLQQPPLDTPWTRAVGRQPWPQHPRPQLRRDKWHSLNGIWTFQSAADATSPGADPPPCAPLQFETLVPSCIESALSGLQRLDTSAMWFATSFAVPPDFPADRTVLLHFEAVDYESTVFVNGVQAGFHRGGYSRHTIDVTHLVTRNKTNALTVFVFDPTDLPGYVIPIGKQTKNPDHIFYRPCSGIWQTVWLESAPAAHITQLDVRAGADGTVTVRALSSAPQSSAAGVDVAVFGPDGHVLGRGRGWSGATGFTFRVAGVRPWSPDAPTLYNLSVTMGDDRVSSYTGFRSVGRADVAAVQRPLLNGRFVFPFATLDQGFWPDGIYLPPTYDAMVYDLLELKKLGFNAVRKHIKVEPDLFYYACDTLGLMVIQDMPSMSTRVPPPNAEQQAEFERQLEVMINEHLSYTCIVTWVIYNEGWGQLLSQPYPEVAIANRIRSLDPSRLIDATSGWHDHGAGDFSDNHHYASPQCGTPFYSIPSSPYDTARIGIQGEFGGIGLNASIENLWNVQQALDSIDQTYELNVDRAAYNYRAHVLFTELRQQVQRYACSGGIWTQTTDVEGEVNGLLTYDRRVSRPDPAQWKADIQSLYDAAAARGGHGNATAALPLLV